MRPTLPDTLCAVAIAAALFWLLCAGLGVITQ